MSPWLISLVSTVVGFLLAILAEPLKVQIVTFFRTRNARNNIYLDVALYLARLRRVKAERLDQDVVINVLGATRFPTYKHYLKREYELLLRIRERHGLQLLISNIRHETKQLATKPLTGDSLAAFFMEIENQVNRAYIARDVDKTLLEKMTEAELERLMRIR